MRSTSTVAIIFLAVGFTASSARATDPAVGVTCSPVNARIVTFYFVDGCTSVYGVCTAGTVDSGVLAGTTQFGVTSITPGDTPGVLLYTGELAITTLGGGVLFIEDNGALNGADGTYFEFDQIVGGTNELKDATGTLFASGISTPPVTDVNGVVITPPGFDGTLSGQICGVADPGPVLDGG